MQFPRFYHLVQLPAQPHQLFVNGTPVRFDLGFAGSTHKAKPAPLTFQMGPRPHKTGSLITQRRHFNLQNALTGPGPVTENF